MSLQSITARSPLLLAIALLSSGCLAPVLHQVEIADFGSVTASASGQIFAIGVQGSGQVAVGVLPHVQLEASAALDVYGDWSAGGGIRGQIPLGGGVSLQVAALYEHQLFAPENYSTGDDTNNCVGAYGCLNASITDSLAVEAGVVARIGTGPRAPAVGFWIREGIGTQTAAAGPPSTAEYDQLISSGVMELPLDDARNWNLLIGFTARVAARSLATGSVAIPEVLSGGAGFLARF